MTTRGAWALELLGHGFVSSAEMADGVVAWGVAEGSAATWNPLDTTEPWAGATDYNSVGVKNYATESDGIFATLATLNNGYYPGVLAVLRDPASTALDLARAVGASPWGTGDFSAVVNRVQADRNTYYSQVVAGSAGPEPPAPTTDDQEVLVCLSS